MTREQRAGTQSPACWLSDAAMEW